MSYDAIYYVDEVDGGRYPFADGTKERPFRSPRGAVYAAFAAPWKPKTVHVITLRSKPVAKPGLWRRLFGGV